MIAAMGLTLHDSRRLLLGATAATPKPPTSGSDGERAA